MTTRATDDRDLGRESYVQRTYGGYPHLLVSRPVRMILGIILLGAFVLWLVQGDAVPADKLGHNLKTAVEKPYTSLAEPWKDPAQTVDANVKRPRGTLSLPLVPPFVEDALGSFNAGVAGLLLLVGAMFAGKKLGFLLVPAALFMVIGHWLGTELVSPLGHTSLNTGGFRPTTFLIGGVVAGFALWKFRD